MWVHYPSFTGPVGLFQFLIFVVEFHRCWVLWCLTTFSFFPPDTFQSHSCSHSHTFCLPIRHQLPLLYLRISVFNYSQISPPPYLIKKLHQSFLFRLCISNHYPNHRVYEGCEFPNHCPALHLIFFFSFFSFYSSILSGGAPLFLAAPESVIRTSKIQAFPHTKKLCTLLYPRSSFSASVRSFSFPLLSSFYRSSVSSSSGSISVALFNVRWPP